MTQYQTLTEAPSPKPVNVAEAARRIPSTTESAIRARLAKGDIKGVWVGGRQHIPIEELRRFYGAAYKES